MIDLVLADGTRHSFDNIRRSMDPLPVGHRMDMGGPYTWEVRACLPRREGGYWIGLDIAIVHRVNVNGERVT
jgi:hypothetical protein